MKRTQYAAVGLLAALCVLLRTTALESDAYPRLSWSSALLTDEGFYLHNARNLVLFGQARLDGFNNMLIMPLLHLAQVGWFHLLGVGLVQARLLSVVCSLLTLGFFTDGLRRAFGPRAAVWGLLLLGLDHVNLLYNRLALMDTPGALVLTAAWWAWVRGSWLGCGLLLGAGYGVRGLDALLWPVAIGVLWGQGKRREAGQVLLGILSALGVYILTWGQPHRVELARVNHYYLFHQLLPHSLRQLTANLYSSSFNWQRGILPYLFKHSPIQLALCLAALPVLLKTSVWAGSLRFTVRRGDSAAEREDPAPTIAHSSLSQVREYDRTGGLAVLSGWLWLAIGCMAAVNYAPSRYYVLFYPALAGVSAWMLNYLYDRYNGRRALPCLLTIAWGVVNLGWTLDWMLHLTYRQRDAEQWIARNLPADSVLLGDVAPCLGVNSRLKVVNVIAGLCNDDHPLEKYAGRPRYIVILDGHWKESWWVKHYPRVVATNHRMTAFRGLLRPFFVIGVYSAPSSSPERVPIATLATRRGAASSAVP